MKRLFRTLPICFLALGACREEPRPRAELTAPPVAQATPPTSGDTTDSQPAKPQLTGTVVETMDSGGYTYVQLDAGSEGRVWVAGPSTNVEVGDTVDIASGMLMQEFVSKTLNRTFENIYFANALRVAGEGSGSAAAPKSAGEVASEPPEKIEVEKVEGGLTVAEIFEKADALAGQEVLLRGQVVKFNGGIMGRNWLHVRDGTGAAGTNDLTVTTDGTANVGDVVVIRGKLATNKDFGAGYSYPVIVEDASLTR
jgi:hypothetical protein